MSLSEIRKKKEIRAIDMAAKLGISQGYYTNLERGKRPFNETLLKKTAQVLGVPIEELRKETKSGLEESHKLKSWMSNIRINGLPLMKAFQYYVETMGIENQIRNNSYLKKQIMEFVEANIGYSVLAELSENKSLLNQVRQRFETKEINT